MRDLHDDNNHIRTPDDNPNIWDIPAFDALTNAVPPRPPPTLERCPHCQKSYGRASLSIHVSRCRVKHEAADDHDVKNTKEPVTKGRRRRSIPSLQDLCLRFVLSNLDVHVINQKFSQPAYQAELLASLPPPVSQMLFLALLTKLRDAQGSLRVLSTRRAQAKESSETHETQVVTIDRLKKERTHLMNLRHRSEQQLVTLRQAGHHLKAENAKLQSQLVQAQKTIEKAQIQHDRQNQTLHRLKSKLKQQTS